MIRTIDYLIQMKETFEYIRVLARTARLGFFGGQKHIVRLCFVIMLFLRQRTRRKRERERDDEEKNFWNRRGYSFSLNSITRNHMVIK